MRRRAPVGDDRDERMRPPRDRQVSGRDVSTYPVLLVAWAVILVPGGVVDLVLNPHRAATAATVVILGGVVVASAIWWTSAIGAVTAVLASLLLVDDAFEARGWWGGVSIAADVALLIVALVHQAVSRGHRASGR
jgi:xanthine/CO dehydrogenase XdhC/CoxF family maturation factor